MAAMETMELVKAAFFFLLLKVVVSMGRHQDVAQELLSSNASSDSVVLSIGFKQKHLDSFA